MQRAAQDATLYKEIDMKLKFAKYALAAMTLALSLPAMAQRPTGGGAPDLAARYDFIAGYLNLSDSQKAQATAIFSASTADRDAMQGKMQSAQEALQAAVKGNKTDFEIDQLAATIGALEGQGTAARAKVEKKFYAILTDEQKKKLETLQQNGMAGGNPGGGRPAGVGGRP